MTVQVSLIGVKELLERLSIVKQASVIHRSMNQAGKYLAGWSKKNRLRGPRPKYLGVRTGRLRASIEASKLMKVQDGWQIKVGTNVKYAGVHEFGFNQRVQVRGHIRRFKQKVRFTKFTAKPGSLVAEQKRVTRTRTSGYAHVKPHGRHMRIRERPFLRPAIESRTNQLQILNYFTQNINKALAKGK